MSRKKKITRGRPHPEQKIIIDAGGPDAVPEEELDIYASMARWTEKQSAYIAQVTGPVLKEFNERNRQN